MLGSSLHDILTQIKSQPQTYPKIDISYSSSSPLLEPVIITLPANGIRLRFDGPEQKLRLVEVLDFGKTQLLYKNTELVKLAELTTVTILSTAPSQISGPVFRHVYNRLMGPTFPGEYMPPEEGGNSTRGIYTLSYPGIAFNFPLQHTAWGAERDFVSLLSSSAALPANSMAIFDGPSWPEARGEVLTKSSPNPRTFFAPSRKDYRPDELEMANIYGGGKIELVRRSSAPLQIVLGQTSTQDLITELGPPDAIYRKSDRRLSIHDTTKKESSRTRSHLSTPSASPVMIGNMGEHGSRSSDTTSDESEEDADSPTSEVDDFDLSAECFYNYFHHGLDILISYPKDPSPPLPLTQPGGQQEQSEARMGELVVTKMLLHGNVPGSYPFNRYRRLRWRICDGDKATDLCSEASFPKVSQDLRHIWSKSNDSDWLRRLEKGMVLNRSWGDSPGSSCEFLGGWEESTNKSAIQRRSNESSAMLAPGSENTELFGFPGMIFEVMSNNAVSCLTVY